MTWEPDGRRIAVACTNHLVHLLDAATGETLAKNACAGVIEGLIWEPAGQSVLILSQSYTALWRPDENTFQYLLTLARPPRAAAWSPDRAYIAIATEYQVLIWRAATLLARGMQLAIERLDRAHAYCDLATQVELDRSKAEWMLLLWDVGTGDPDIEDKEARRRVHWLSDLVSDDSPCMNVEASQEGVADHKNLLTAPSEPEQVYCIHLSECYLKATKR
jgi:hypothetical protein